MTTWLLETFVAVTLLLLLVLVVRRPVARMFGAGWAYALWLVPAARLILPPLPQIFPQSNLPPAVIFIPTASEATASLPVEAGPGQWVPFMLALWAGGAVIFLTLQWLAYRAFLKQLGAHSRPARPPRYGGISTLISKVVEGPLALGLIERRIVIPCDFSRRYSPDERRLALEHELTHHRRGDIWWNFAAMLFLAVNWFNPVAWIAFRAFRTDQELACDATIAAKSSPAELHDYARALVKSASAPGLIAACPLHHAEQLKRRLRMMRAHKVSRTRTAGGFAAVAAFALTGFSFGAGPGAEAPEIVYAAAPEAAIAPMTKAQPVRLASIAVAPAAPSPAKAVSARPAPKAKPAPAAVPAAPAPTEAEPAPAAAPAPVNEAFASAPHSAIDRLLPHLAALPVEPRPAPHATASAFGRARGVPAYTHHHSYKVVTRGHRSVESHEVLVIPSTLTDEQRSAIKAAIRRAKARVASAERAERFALLRMELEQIVPGKIKVQRVIQGE